MTDEQINFFMKNIVVYSIRIIFMYKSRHNQRFEKMRALFNFSTMDEPQHAKACRARQNKARARRETNQLKLKL